MINKTPKIAYYTEYIPHYRHGLFELLSGRDDMAVVFASAAQAPDKTIYSPKERKFSFRPIHFWYLRLPNHRNRLSFSRHVLYAMIRKEYDVLILSNNILGIDVWLCCLLKPFLGGRIILWGQGISRPETAFRIHLRKRLMRLADACVFYGDEARNTWVSRGMEPDKLFVAYNALDTDIQFFLKQTLRDLDCFRNKHGLENKKVIIFAGRLVPEKRADHVIRAMKKVIQTVPDAHLIVVGDGPERKKLEYLVEEIGVKNCCSLIGEIYNEEILARYFLISRAAVMPAYAGLAIQHAFAYAVPVILGDIRDSHGPEAKLVVNGGTGLYFKDSDINGLAAAIMEILENDSLYQHLSHNAFQVITEKHNKQKMADGIIQAIRWALK